MQPGNPGHDPYGQQPPHDPYGQQPVPGQPQDPYAAPQAPYGQQPATPYGEQPPYGQQPPHDPYGPQPTSGQPYGQPLQPDPYGQPVHKDPYGQQPYAAAAGSYPGAGYPTPQGQQNTLGLVSLILGIASLPLLCCLFLGLPVAIGAVITGWLGMQKANQGLASNGGQAKAGLICGAVAVGLGILLLLLNLIGSFTLPTSP
ncbi:hypothetical protein TPA0907_63390 [Micromonospora humidisoli]|uniref:DUF4190 domain-containing protein n=1 Tax=Micromonospora humidisoli TaxID=2807622 RepID=A0ABS2J7M0_9ACTN|nr:MULTISPECIES: DUF4190 domain-containing protein [Micromonospora]MBM7082542.1 hypothetical protein [Micromonospora humidisoli]GHJ05887.1 hypothetical protein TPA0907_02540 [Micromonospora sp. AKA109]GHJ11972.1 hypothetical protein TPA0907_63390 [Micromonospora sp. AKA109]